MRAARYHEFRAPLGVEHVPDPAPPDAALAAMGSFSGVGATVISAFGA